MEYLEGIGVGPESCPILRLLLRQPLLVCKLKDALHLFNVIWLFCRAVGSPLASGIVKEISAVNMTCASVKRTRVLDGMDCVLG